MKSYLTAQEATELLGISLRTLYSYVSRGLIRSETGSDDSRSRRYNAEDVQKLVNRKAQRRDPARAAEEALHWGSPILESALTLIDNGRLYYRGLDVVELAQNRRLEEVAALLWMGNLEDSSILFPPFTSQLTAAQWRFIQSVPPVHAMQMALVAVSGSDWNAYQLQAEQVSQTGARILWLLGQAVTGKSVRRSLGETLADAWQSGTPRLFDAALILCADHELNASSFTARVVASAEATPYEVVTGGLSALQGVKHGGLTRRVAAFLREVEVAGSVETVLQERLRRGDPIPGFGHRLYPNGDPRAVTLLDLLEQTYPSEMPWIREVAASIYRVTGEHPTIDLGLGAMERIMRLPQDSALVLFALGRTVGWIGHAIEQYATNQLIRPRARYIGPLP
jgi:citrate synthase